MRTQGTTPGPPTRTTPGRAQTLTCLLPTPLLGEEHSPGSLTFTYNLGLVGEEETVQGFSTSCGSNDGVDLEKCRQALDGVMHEEL